MNTEIEEPKEKYDIEQAAIMECVRQLLERYNDFDMKNRDSFSDGFIRGTRWMYNELKKVTN